MEQTCKNCFFWEPYDYEKHGKQFGTCHLHTRPHGNGKIWLNENSTGQVQLIETREDFGCNGFVETILGSLNAPR